MVRALNGDEQEDIEPKRVIKFRAWDKRDRLMFTENVLLQFKLNTPLGNVIPESIELMQFTGLFDKNSKEIYEGDFADHNGILYECVFEEGMFNFRCHTWRDDGLGESSRIPDDLVCNINEVVKVIGNIYENGDLL